MEWAQNLANARPLSLAATKKVMRFAMDNDWDSCFELEAELQGQLLGSEDNRGRHRGLFRETRSRNSRASNRD